MRIEWATVCLGADYDENGFPNLRGILLDTTYVDALDEPLDLNVATVLAESYANLHVPGGGRTRYTIQWMVRGPDLRKPPLVAMETSFPVYIDPDRYPEGWDGRMVALLLVTFTPPAEGAYEIQISVEKEKPTILTHVVELSRTDADAPPAS